jgi:antitoxin (DNA-binding transcriptional repressor) of toxin-antitoxin stability system
MVSGGQTTVPSSFAVVLRESVVAMRVLAAGSRVNGIRFLRLDAGRHPDMKGASTPRMRGNEFNRPHFRFLPASPFTAASTFSVRKECTPTAWRLSVSPRHRPEHQISAFRRAIARPISLLRLSNFYARVDSGQVAQPWCGRRDEQGECVDLARAGPVADVTGLRRRVRRPATPGTGRMAQVGRPGTSANDRTTLCRRSQNRQDQNVREHGIPTAPYPATARISPSIFGLSTHV